MATTVEHLIEAVKFIAEGQGKLGMEFLAELESQVAAGDMLAASVFDVVETMVRETDVEENDQCPYEAEDHACGEDQIIKLSTTLYNLLVNLTTYEAKEVVRRWWEVDMDSSHESDCARRFTRGPWHQE